MSSLGYSRHALTGCALLHSGRLRWISAADRRAGRAAAKPRQQQLQYALSKSKRTMTSRGLSRFVLSSCVAGDTFGVRRIQPPTGATSSH